MAWYHRLRNVLRPDRTSRQLDDEFSFHIEERVDELMASGLSEKEARRLAKRQFGSYQASKERARDMDTVAWLESIGRDVRFSLRNARRKPLFFLASVLTLALGIGATTTIYSVVDAVILRVLPYPDPDRLVYFDNASHSFPQWRAWQNLDSFDTIGAVSTDPVDLTGVGVPQRLPAAWVSPQFFRLIGAEPVHGRLFGSDDYPGTNSLGVISYAAWDGIWGKDPRIVGRSVRINGKPVEVIGVLSRDLQTPEIVTGNRVTGNRVDVWFPLGNGGAYANDFGYHVLSVIGRLRPSRSIEAAQAQVDATQAAFVQQSPRDFRLGNGTIATVPLVGMKEATVRDIRRTLWILLGVAAFLHLIACTNVANLFLARATSRSREIALRGALGASRLRIASQVITESVVVALIGGIAGSGLAYAGVEAFTRLNPGGIPRLHEMAVDARILFFALAVSALTGVLFGWLPAVHAMCRNVSDALKSGSSATTTSRAGIRVRSALVVVETALAVVLLIGAGLLFRTLVAMVQVDPGFKSEKLVIVPLSLDAGYKEDDRRLFIAELEAGIEALPGIRSVSGARALPFEFTRARGYSGMRLAILPEAGDEANRFVSMIHMVTKGFFTTLGVPIAYGRDFSAADMSGKEAVAILNRRTARRLFGEDNVIGRRFKFGGSRFETNTLTVIGVVDGMHHWGVTREVEEDVYVPYPQFGAFQPSFEFVLRTDADLGAIAGPIRETIWSIDPNLPLPPALTMEQRISSSLSRSRFLSVLFAAFAGVALLLSCSGIFATLLYTVSERRREMGIRLALGARNSDLLRLVLRYGAVLAIGGIAIGIFAGLALSRLIQGMLWKITPTDPPTFIAVALLFGATSIIASLVPAWNASRTDPLTTLRSD